MDTQSTSRLLAADRIAHLGTDTVFAVVAEAANYSAKGGKVYPFHIGDLNFPTPENVVEATMRAIRDGKTTYCPNAGIPELRDALAGDVGGSRGVAYRRENVSVHSGGKSIISKFLLALMNPGDAVLYPDPGFPIYRSMIDFFGGRPVPYTYQETEDRFRLDLERIENAITPSTRLFILNDLHNPTAAECSPEELEWLAEFVLRHDLFVLCDEAYFDMRFEGSSRSLVSLPGMRERCVVLYTFSKKFAMTGWRLGAAIGPKWVIDIFADLNLNEESCTNHFVQWGAIEALEGDQIGPQRIVQTLKERRDVAVEMLNSIDGVRCIEPNATFYLYPSVTGVMARMGVTDYESFRRGILLNTGVSVCTRAHFGKVVPGEPEFYLRFAYSGIGVAEIREGLGKLKDYLEDAGGR